MSSEVPAREVRIRPPHRHRCTALAATSLALVVWALYGGAAGCSSTSTPAGCRDYVSQETASPDLRLYDYPVSKHTVDARGVDFVGAQSWGVELKGSADGDGCFVGGRIQGTFSPSDSWDLYHNRAGISVGLQDKPAVIEDLHVVNHGDGASLEVKAPCPNGSPSWMIVRRSLFENVHDDAIESDGLCSVEVSDSLIDRAFVAFAFRHRLEEPWRNGNANTVYVLRNLVRLHAFINNYHGQTQHNGFWKWAFQGRGPKIVVRHNRFLAFDAPPDTTLFPLLNKVVGCEDNVFLFAGSEAEWQQALLGGCSGLEGEDGLCDGERMLQLGYCYTVITKPDTQSEIDFLSEYWSPYVLEWKARYSADDE